MKVQLEDPAQEIKRLQRCINDLISVLALPAIWIGSEPSRIVGNLLDGLLNMLSLDFIYARLGLSTGEALEFLWASPTWEARPQPQEVSEMVRSWLGDSTHNWPELTRKSFKNRDISMLPLPLGLQGEIGALVAGSERIDFPQQTERLILSVAASQASIGLQEARFRSQQKRIADELDQRVAQRTAELAAANAELQLQVGLLQHLPVSAWTLRPDGTPDFVNQVWLEFSGQTLEFVRSHPEAWMTAVHPEDRETAAKAFWEGVRSGQGFAIETRSLRARDGTYRWHLQQAVALRDAEGKILKFVGTTTDIDDQKRAQEKLRRSEEKWRSIFDNSAVGVVLSDLNGYFIAANAVFQRMVGYTEDELRKFTFFDITHEDDIGRNRSLIGELLDGKCRQFQMEKRFRCKDGKLVWARLNVCMVSFSEQAARFLVALVEDITERRLSEEALAKARSELAKMTSITSLGVLTASIAHEVNQPLSGIVTNAGTCLRMLDANPPNLEGAKETARRTIRDGHRAADVVTRLRTLYSKKEPTLESMDLNEAVREVTALSSTEIQRSGVILRQEFADNLPPALGDRIQLQQVILNLLRNAADAMSTVDDRPRELLVRTERDEGNQVRLSVKDSGVGLTPQAADKIFEAFYTTKTDGMGMGLSISRSIIEAHQGRLWATPNDGPGSTFSFSILCNPEGPADAETRVNQANPSRDAA